MAHPALQAACAAPTISAQCQTAVQRTRRSSAATRHAAAAPPPPARTCGAAGSRRWRRLVARAAEGSGSGAAEPEADGDEAGGLEEMQRQFQLAGADSGGRAARTAALAARLTPAAPQAAARLPRGWRAQRSPAHDLLHRSHAGRGRLTATPPRPLPPAPSRSRAGRGAGGVPAADGGARRQPGRAAAARGLAHRAAPPPAGAVRGPGGPAGRPGGAGGARLVAWPGAARAGHLRACRGRGAGSSCNAARAHSPRAHSLRTRTRARRWRGGCRRARCRSRC